MSALPLPWDFAVILLVLAILVPWRGAVKMRELFARPQLNTTDRLVLYATTIAFQCFAVAVVLWRTHARHFSFRDLGIAIADPPLCAAVALALSAILLGYQLIGLRRFARLANARSSFLFHLATKILPQNLVESLAFAALVVTVALCEEFLYRGFVFLAVTRAAHNSLFAGAVFSSALFAVAHAYQGRRGMILTFFIGLLFAGVRIWTGSLVPSISAHLSTDLVAGLAAPRILRQAFARQSAAEENSHP